VSRIIITTIGSLGDLHPKIAIALELRQRGHDIAFATHKGYQAKIEALGFEFHALRPDGTDDLFSVGNVFSSTGEPTTRLGRKHNSYRLYIL